MSISHTLTLSKLSAIVYLLIALTTSYSPVLKQFFSLSQAIVLALIIIFYGISYLIVLNTKSVVNNATKVLFTCYTTWIFVSCISAVLFYAHTYSDYICMLVALTGTLIPPLIVHAFSQQKIITEFYHALFSLYLPFAIFSPFIFEHWGYEQFFGIFLIWLPCILIATRNQVKWVILLLFIYVLVIYANDRTMLIRCSLLFGISLLVYFRHSTILRATSCLRRFFIIVPIICIVLAFACNFSIFKVGDYLDVDIEVYALNYEGEQESTSLLADSRTPLFTEIWQSAIKHNHVLTGRSPARGNETQIFYEYSKRQKYGRIGERFGNEMLLTNVFTWTGIVGLILYSLFSIYASWLAIYKSNNRFIKILGCFVAIRWSIAWVEENGITIVVTTWMYISFCLSKDIRNMTDSQYISLFKSIFSKKYKSTHYL